MSFGNSEAVSSPLRFRSAIFIVLLKQLFRSLIFLSIGGKETTNVVEEIKPIKKTQLNPAIKQCHHIIASNREYENFNLKNIFFDQSLLLLSFFVASAIHPLYVLIILQIYLMSEQFVNISLFFL